MVIKKVELYCYCRKKKSKISFNVASLLLSGTDLGVLSDWMSDLKSMICYNLGHGQNHII